MSDKSSVYGYYGRVSDENEYIPPASIPFVPQPSLITINLDGENATLVDEQEDVRLEFEA